MPFLPRLTNKVASLLSPKRRKKKNDENSSTTTTTNDATNTPISCALASPTLTPTSPRPRHHPADDYNGPEPDSGREPTFLGSLHSPHQSAAMADGEPDYSSLPLTDRWVHKVRTLPPNSAASHTPGARWRPAPAY